MTDNPSKSGNSKNLLIGCVIICIIMVTIGIILYFYFNKNQTSAPSDSVPTMPICDRAGDRRLTTSCLCGTVECAEGSYCSEFGCTPGDRPPEESQSIGVFVVDKCQYGTCTYKSRHDNLNSKCLSKNMRLCDRNELCKGPINRTPKKFLEKIKEVTSARPYIAVNDAPNQWITVDPAFGEPCTLIADPSNLPIKKNDEAIDPYHTYGRCCLV